MERLSQLEAIRDWQGLVEELEKAIGGATDGPTKSELFLRYGTVLEQKFLSGAKALKAYQDAFKANTANVISLAAARSVYWDLGKLNMVQKLLELELKAHSTGPKAAELLVELADVHYESGDIEKATAAFARALSASAGESQEASASLEDVQVDSSSWQALVKDLSSSADRESNARAKSRLLLRAARIAKRFSPNDVEALLLRAYSADPTYNEVANAYEGLLAEGSRLDELEVNQTEILTSIPDRTERARFAFTFGKRWVQRHQNPDVGVRFLEDALRLDSSYDGAFLFLRDHYGRKSNDHQRVLSIVEEAATQSSDPHWKSYYVAQAALTAWKDVSNLIRAKSWFEQLALLEPEHPQLKAFETQIGETIVPGGAERPASLVPPKPSKNDRPTAPPPAVATRGSVAPPAQEATPAPARTESIPPPPAAPQIEEASIMTAPPPAPSEPREETPAPPAVEEVVASPAPAPVAAASVAPPAASASVAPPAAAAAPASDSKIAELRATAEKQESAKRFNEYVKTLLLLAQAVSDPAEKVELYLKAADLYVNKFANQAEAVKAYEQVIAIDADNAAAEDYLRQMYEKRRDWEKLLNLQRRDAERTPEGSTRAQKFVEMAKLATERVKKPELSIELWNEVLKNDDANPDALTALGPLFERTKEFDKLASVLEKQIDITYDSAAKVQLLSKLGTLYGDRLNNDVGAVDAWRMLLSLDPNDRKAQEALKKKYLALGRWDDLETFYAESGKWDEFIRVLEQQEAKETETEGKIGLLFKIAELWAERKQKLDRAAKSYEKILELDAQNLRAADALAPLYTQSGNSKALANVYEVKLHHETDETARLGLLRETAALYEGKVREPEKAFERYLSAFELVPTDEQAAADIERVAKGVNGWERVVTAYKSAIDSAEGQGDSAAVTALRLRLGRVLVEEVGRTDEALAAYRAVYEAENDNAVALSALERLYRSTNQFSSLLEIYTRKSDLALEPEERRAIQFEIARLYEGELKEVEKAIETYNGVLEEQPADAEALEALDRLYGDLSRWEPFADVLRRRIELEANDARIVDFKFRLGTALEKHLDDARGALENYREILLLDQSHEGARLALENLLAHPELKSDAAAILESIYEERSDWPKLIATLEILAATEDDVRRSVQLQRKIARISSTTGDQERAFKALSTALRADPSQDDTRHEIEQVAEVSESFPALVALYKEVAGGLSDADLARNYWFRVAGIYERLDKIDDAADAYQQVLKLDGTDEAAIAALENLFTRTERWTDLISVIQRRVDQSADSELREGLLFRMAQIFDEKVGKPEEAIGAYRKVLDIDASNERALAALETILARQKLWPELAENLESQLALAAEDQEQLRLMLRLASLRETEMAQTEQAIEGYRSVLERDLNSQEALSALERLGQSADHELAIAEILEPLYRQLGDFKKLIGVHEVQVRRATESDRRVELLGQIATLHEDAANDFNSAFDTYARALREEPSNESTQQSIDRVARGVGRFRDLAEVYKDLAEKAEDATLSTTLYMMAARVHEADLGEADAAIALYRKVLGIDATHLDAAVSLERIFRSTERYSELSEVLQQKAGILAEPQDKKEALFQAASIEEDVLERPEAAIAVYNKVLELDGEDVRAMDALIKRYIGLSRWADLMAVYARKAELVLDPEEKKRIYYQIGAVYERELTDVTRAIETYQKILELDPDDLQALSRLDSLYEQAENWAELLNVLTRESEMTSDPMEALSFQYRIADLYDRRLDDVTRAIELYREILTAQSDHSPALRALEILKDGERDPLGAAAVLEQVYDGTSDVPRLISVLEVQARHSTDPIQTVELLHRIARLQEDSLNDPRAAFDTYARAVTQDNGNELTLASLERLATVVERWPAVAKLYDAELEKLGDTPDRFVELGLRTSQIYEVQLENVDEAIAHYRRVLEKDSENQVAIRSLDRLFLQTARWKELTEILVREAEIGQTPDEILEFKYRLGQVEEHRLSNLDGAIAAYREVMNAAPEHQPTLEALESLFSRQAKLPEVTDILEPLYRSAGEWHKLAGVYEAQLGITEAKDERLAAYYRIAELTEDKLVDPDATLRVYLRALKEAPLDEKTGEELPRLAGSVDNGWEILANGYADVIGVHEDKTVQTLIGKRLAHTFEDELGDITKAEETYKYVLSVDPLDSDALANLDRIYLSLESFTELAEVLEQRIQATTEPIELVELHARLGEIYETKLGKQGDAIRVFKRVFDDLDKSHEGAIAALGRIYEGQANWAELNTVYERELTNATGDVAEAEIRAKIARLASERLGDPQRAIDTWKVVLDLRGEDPEALGALALLYEAGSQWQELVDVLERHFETAGSDDDRVNVLTRRARIFTERLNEDAKALDDWNRVLDIDYANLAALRSVANIRRRQEDPNELVTALHQIVDRATNFLDGEEIREVYRELGKTYGQKMEQPFDAAEAWKKLIESGADFEAFDALEGIYRSEERWTDVIDVKMMRAEALEDTAAKVDEFRSVAVIWTDTLQEPDSATTAYQKILGVDGASDEAFFELEKRHQTASRWEQLIELYLARLDTRTETTERTDLLRKIARVFEEHLEDKNQAFDALLTALNEDFHDRETARYLERMAQATGRWGELIQNVNQWLKAEKDPQQKIRLCLHLAKWYGDDLGHPEHAQPYYTMIVQLDPNNVGAKRQLAQLYRKNANWTQVGATLTSALDVAIADVDRKEIMTELGELLDSQMSQTDQAIGYFTRALEVDGHYLPAIEHLERIYGARGLHKDLVDVLKRKVSALSVPEDIATTKLRVASLYESNLNEPQKAAQVYREVVDVDNTNLQGLRGLGRVYEALEHWPELVRVLERELEVVTTERERMDALLQLAKLQEEQFLKPDLAAQRLEEVLAIDPNHEDAYFALERNLRKLHQWLDLIQVYERHVSATAERKTKVDLYGSIAQVYADEIADADRAIDAYRNIVDLDDTNVPALEALAKLYEKQGDAQQAVDFMGRVADLTPDTKQRVESFYRIAKILDEKLGDRVSAQERYEMTLDIEPAHIPSLAAVRQIALDAGDYDRAAKYIDQEQSFTTAPRQRAKLLVELGRLREEHLGDHDSAVLAWQSALEADEENEDAALPLADEYLAQSQWEHAEPLLDMLVRKAGKRDKTEQKELQKKLAKAAFELNKDEKAHKAYTAALQLDLTDQETIRGLAEVSFRLKDWAAALSNYQKVLTSLPEEETEARATVYYRLGSIKREQGQPKQAIGNYEKALGVDGSHRPTLDALVDTYAELKDWKQSVSYRRQILDNVFEGQERFNMLVEIADVWKDKEKDFHKAVEALEEARDINPTDHPLLHKMLELYQGTENWDKMVDTIQAIAEMEKDSIRKSKFIYTVAQLYRDKLQDQDRAVELFNDALDLNPKLLEAFERINKILTATKDWKNLERAYRKMLHRLSTPGNADKRLEQQLWHQLGLIYRDRLQNPASSIEAFRMAAQRADDAPEQQIVARQILAELFEQSDQVDNAIGEHQEILQKDPMRVDPYRSLYRLYMNQHQYDRAWCMTAALTFLRKASEEEQQFFEQYRPKGMLQVKSRLDNEQWVKNLFHSEESIYVGKIFEMITPAAIVAKMTQLRAARQLPVLDKRFKQDPATSTVTFAKTFGWAATVLGVPLPELYVRNDVAGALSAVPSSPPASVAGQSVLTGFTPQELTFIVGKHLAYYRGEHYMRTLFPTMNELKVMLFAAIKIVAPDFAVPGEMAQAVNTTAQELAKHMQPVQRDSLRLVVQRFMEDGARADLKRWLQVTEVTAARAGLLLCADLEIAKKIIAAEPQLPGDLPPGDKMKELLAFSVSEQYFILRQALGIAVG